MATPTARRFWLRTFGCQMNVHDSEKVSNLLLHSGYRAADDPEDADVLIVNTCSIRDKAEQRLYSDLGVLRDWKSGRSGRVLGVGGCVAQQEGDALLRRFTHVDFVFGTHNLRLVPAMASAALQGERSTRIDETASVARFDFPERHPDFAGNTPGRAFVTVMEGCDMFCTFCIVPTTRGREISRPAESIEIEVRELAARGVREVTLLGQTVNAYGRHDLRRGHAGVNGTRSFAALIRDLAGIQGIERIRYTSPHPLFFDADLVQAHREVEALCPHVHLPLQSGSDRVLSDMRRRYTADAFRRIAGDLRDARPDLAITTDLIVGFPGETDADFRETLALVREVAFIDSFSFKYSPRPGTAAASLERDTVPPEVAQARLEELQTLQRDLTLAAHRARVGRRTDVLLEGSSRRGNGQLMGRDPYHRVVNFQLHASRGAAADAPSSTPEFGSIFPGTIVEATPPSLIAELTG